MRRRGVFSQASAEGNSADVPAITSAAKWAPGLKPILCFNIGMTYKGLRALGTPAEHLATFPTEFVEGMAKRALKLGDFGASAPDKWPAPFDQPARVISSPQSMLTRRTISIAFRIRSRGPLT